MNLKSTITKLADDFATGVLIAIRGASLEDLLGETGGRAAKSNGTAKANGVAKSNGAARQASAAPAPSTRKSAGRLHRRSEEEIAGLAEKIVSILKGNTDGLRAEQIREQLGIDAKELPRPLKEALRTKRVSKKGRKRATTYFAR